MIQGTINPDFWPVARALQRQLRRTPEGGGAAVCVYHRGEKVVDIHGGTRDAAGTPWTADTLSVSFSTTKAVTGIALHRLVDQGLLDYDDPVRRFWPEFDRHGKRDVTVRHLLSHRAGLWDVRHTIDHADRMLDWQYMTGALANATPAHAPGRQSAYHGLTYGWLVGEVVRRVSGRPLADVVQSEIAEPLGVDGLWIGAPPDVQERAATIMMPRARLGRLLGMRGILKPMQQVLGRFGFPQHMQRFADALIPHGIDAFDWSAPATLAASIPAANGLFSAQALAKLYAVLAAGGSLDGVKLLSESTLARATEVQCRRVDGVVPFPMHWRLGFHRAATTRGTPARGFGHYGFGGSGAWACPDRQLAVALVLNSGFGTPFGDMRTAEIGGAALRCANRLAAARAA